MAVTGAAGPVVLSTPRWWSRPDGRVAALSAGLGLVTLVALAQFGAAGIGPATVGARWTVWLPLLIVLFGVTEGFAIHIRVRRGGHAMSLSEIPMVLALVLVDPVLAILTRVLGGGAGLVLLRGQRGSKLAFNLGLLGVQASVAAAVFHGLTSGSGQLGAREWLATYAAMLLADAAAVALVTAAISLHDDPGEWRRLPAALRGVPLVAVATTVALLSALAVARHEWSLLLLGIVSVVLYLAYRAYSQQSSGHARVEELYTFTQALDGAEDVTQLGQVVLDRTRDLLRAEAAELIVPDLPGRAATRSRMSGRSDMLTTPLALGPTDAWWAPALASEPVLMAAGTGTGEPVDGMAVPVSFGDVAGVLLVTGSLPDITTFHADGLRLFQALANHAGVALAKASLVDRLRREGAEKEHLALHDPLTDLPNRRQFHRLLDEAVCAGTASGRRVAVLLLDLDRFKEINDALGHDTGDALLREVAGRLDRLVSTRRAGGTGMVARLGGDEFAVLLPDLDRVEDALGLAAEVARSLERSIQVGPLSLSARASIGIAAAPDHGADAQTLLRRADVAMYSAKTTRAGIRVYHPADDLNTPHRLSLITDLRDAIERREIMVAFQPKLDPHTGRVIGAEALARWLHAEHGNIAPDQFIPLAEHSGLVQPLTLHVLETALRRRAAWQRAGHDLHVAVNLSPNSLLDASLPDVVTRLLRQTGTRPADLTLEITESTLMADPKGSLATLDQLNALGVRLSIDDFGTGYSSLGRLRELPIHEVKIDKSFVRRVPVDHRDRAVVRSAVQLGHALGLQVVAEGVEDRDTYSYLTREGCNIVQGYLVSRPLPPDEFAAWLGRVRGGGVVVPGP